jgi:hypothetical protein
MYLFIFKCNYEKSIHNNEDYLFVINQNNMSKAVQIANTFEAAHNYKVYQNENLLIKFDYKNIITFELVPNNGFMIKNRGNKNEYISITKQTIL